MPLSPRAPDQRRPHGAEQPPASRGSPSSSAAAAPSTAISVVTAGAVLRAIDRDKYDVLPIGITTDGRWALTADEPGADGHRRPAACPPSSSSPSRTRARVVLPVDPANREVVYTEPGAVPKALGEVDVVFPMLHGPYGEDGTLQGLLELSGVPYVGAGVLASAVGMDKEYMKRVFTSFGLPVGPYEVIRPREWEHDRAAAARRRSPTSPREHGWPLFVKPARAGSSIGITKVDGPEGLDEAIERGPAARPQDHRRGAAARPRDRVRGAGVRGRAARQRARRDPAGQPPRLLRLRGEVHRLGRGRSCPRRSPTSRPPRCGGWPSTASRRRPARAWCARTSSSPTTASS